MTIWQSDKVLMIKHRRPYAEPHSGEIPASCSSRAAMAENGSPPPRFSTDEGRTYFLAELPVHPDWSGVWGAHDEAHDEAYDEAHVDMTASERNILTFLMDGPKSRPEIADCLEVQSRSGHLYKAILELRKMGFIELTIPDKPQSRSQRMRLTDRGKKWLESESGGKGQRGKGTKGQSDNTSGPMGDDRKLSDI